VPVARQHKIQIRQMPGFMKVYEQGGVSRQEPSGLLWLPVEGRKQRLSKYRDPKLIPAPTCADRAGSGSNTSASPRTSISACI
jgi:hypothetical protein